MSETNPLIGKAAVLEGLPDHPAVKAILAWNAEALTDAKFDFAELTLTIVPEQIRAAAETVKAAGYNFFEDVTAVDWFPASPRFQLSYHILSFGMKERIRLRVLLDEAIPAIDSITPIWSGANLRRIMLPEEWQGHPLRKDYPVEGYR
jgi:NADH-quinone oxidoreductase subunit C